MPTDEITVLGIAGSLRRESFNQKLLNAAQQLAPDAMQIKTASIASIPMFNQDVEDEGDPRPVVEFKEAIAASDALLIVTPEYQLGVPGVLKNALDWASRPPGESPMQDKPAAIMGASPGMTATARAQTQLRQTLTYNNAITVNRPEVLIGRAHEKFDEQGQLTDDTATDLIRQVLENLADLTRRLTAA
jgi:chromate reductase